MDDRCLPATDKDAQNNYTIRFIRIIAAMDRLQAMRLFTRIVELGSFSRAAEQLGLPRASATQIIQQLEAHLGVRLLARTTRQVTPTVDGTGYYRRCLRILADLDDAEAEFSQAAHHPQGRIRIDLPDSFCRLLLIPALPEFYARYPLVRIDISVGDHTDNVPAVAFAAGAVAAARAVPPRGGHRRQRGGKDQGRQETQGCSHHGSPPDCGLQ